MLYQIMLATEVVEEETKLFSANQVGGYLSTAVIAIINLLVAYVILRFVFKKFSGVIKSREEKISNALNEAEKAKAEAAIHEAESKKAIEEARAEATQYADEAKENSEKQAEVIIAKAKEEASEILRRAEEDAKRMKKAALEQMKDELSDLAVVIAGRVLGDVMAADDLKPLAEKEAASVLEDEVNKLG